MNTAPTKVVIHVYGGVVQCVVATDKNLDVTVLDCDGDLHDDNGAQWDAILADPNFHPVH